MNIKMGRVVFFFLFMISFSILNAHPKFTPPTGNFYPKHQYIEERADSLTGFDVQKYDLSIMINDTEHTISGTVVTTVLAEQTLTNISYDLANLTVDAVLVNGLSANYTYQDQLINISLPNIAAGTTFTTTVSYHGAPQLSPDSYHIGMIFDTNSVFTLSDPNASRYWWPSYDHPWDKALVDLHVKMRSDWLVASNGIRTQIENAGDNYKIHHWTCTDPIATYLVCITAGPYQEINQVSGTIPIQNFVFSSQYAAAMTDFSTLPQAIQVYSDTFGPYPFQKYGNAVVNMVTYGAMEHQTMTTLGRQYITGDHSGETTIVHELAHQWFGDCLTPLTWKDVWLSEGFATYSEAIWKEKTLGYPALYNYVRTSFHDYYKSWELNNGPHTIYNLPFPEYFTPPSYEKAASVLHALRFQVGDANFWNILRTWFVTYHNQNVVTSEFKQLCEQISGQNLDQFFQQWIFQPGIPKTDYAVFSKQVSNQTLAKAFFLTSANSATPFYLTLPLEITTTSGTDSINVQATPNTVCETSFIVAQPSIQTIAVDPHNWILASSHTNHTPILLNAFAANGRAIINWEAYWTSIPTIGYNVYRSVSGQNTFSRLNTTPINNLSYLDTDIISGTNYDYKITAVIADNYESQSSAILAIHPISFDFENDLLIVDDTKNGTGGVLSPTDETIDQWYLAALPIYNPTAHDLTSDGTLTLQELGSYRIVLWHDDDYALHSIQDYEDILGSYLLGGGKLILSGWKTYFSLSDGFKAAFLENVSGTLINSPCFLTANSNEYPTLAINTTMIPSIWNENLSMTTSFDGAAQPLYTGHFTDQPDYEGHVMAFLATTPSQAAVFGFPLSYMQITNVRSMFETLIARMGGVVGGVETDNTPIPSQFVAYPNPFSSQVSLEVTTPKRGDYQLSLFNMKGQLIRNMRQTASGKTTLRFEWDGKDNSSHLVANGVYIAVLKGNGWQKQQKILYLK